MWVITHETSLQASANLGQMPSVWSGEIIQYRKKGKQTMTETTYDIIAKSLDRISMELHQADENNDFLRIGLLSGQLKAIKENLHRLLWIELPELNESHKIEAVSKSTTGIFFHPGIFEMDAMRQAFFKRQAKHFFDNATEQQEYIEYAEKEYLEATKTLKDILFNTNNGTRQVNKDCLVEKFEEAMQWTQSEFYNRMTKIKDRHPNLFQFIIDFLDDKVSTEEVYDFLKMERSYQVNHIKNYKARA